LYSRDCVGDPDSGFDDGEFVSEDVDPEFTSAIAEKVRDRCFGELFAIHCWRYCIFVEALHDRGFIKLFARSDVYN
jgi:hypothetical protein